MGKAQGARLSVTSISRALTEGVFYLPKRLAYDLEPMAPEAGHPENLPRRNLYMMVIL